MENDNYVFKKSTLAQNQIGGKKRMWKSLKQILATEKTLQWSENAITYSSINTPPSFKPYKKYSDISGLQGLYTDPLSKLIYHNSEEFNTIRSLPMDITAGYLALRGIREFF